MNYDPNDPKSILEFGKRLEGHSMQEFVNPNGISARDKGRLGAYVEKYYGIPRNTTPEADFKTIGGTQLELKTNPLKFLASGKIRVKERLVCNIINYFDVCNETWDNSSFLAKNKNMLFINYIYNRGEKTYEHIIYQVRILRLDQDIPSTDYAQIQRDWESIVNLIRQGKAEELSEGKTAILGACTKGRTADSSYRFQPYSTRQAKQRAFSLKQSYLNSRLHLLLDIAH